MLILALVSLCFSYEVPNMFYIFQLQWPGTICEFNSCYKEHIGNYNGKTWSIHGLWPSATSSKTQGCEELEFCTNNKFNSREITKNTETILQQAWVGFYNPSQSFRAHEWNKHGVCWDEKDDLVPQTNGLTPQEEYFQTALALWKAYNIYDILLNAQIKPDASKNYYTDDIKAALKSQLKTDVQLLCTKDNNNQLFIQSVSFCLSEQYKPIVCACPVFGGIPCGKYKNDKVRYPPFNL